MMFLDKFFTISEQTKRKLREHTLVTGFVLIAYLVPHIPEIGLFANILWIWIDTFIIGD